MKRIAAALAAVLAGVFTAAWIAFDAWVWRELRPPLFPSIEGAGSLSAARCSACHASIVADWSASAHARAAVDPLYLAESERMGDPYYCDHCHAPFVEQRARPAIALLSPVPSLTPLRIANPRFSSELRAEGVTCVACHMGPAQDACERCHALSLEALGALQRPLMETIDEWRGYRARGGVLRCADCHMPGANHRLRDPSELAFAKTMLEVRSATVAVRGRRIEGAIVLRNTTGHRLPTAEPSRRLIVRLELSDAGGSIASDERTIERRLDLERLVERPGEDTTMLPLEEREIAFSIASIDRCPTEARWTIDFTFGRIYDATLDLSISSCESLVRSNPIRAKNSGDASSGKSGGKKSRLPP